MQNLDDEVKAAEVDKKPSATEKALEDLESFLSALMPADAAPFSSISFPSSRTVCIVPYSQIYRKGKRKRVRVIDNAISAVEGFLRDSPVTDNKEIVALDPEEYNHKFADYKLPAELLKRAEQVRAALRTGIISNEITGEKYRLHRIWPKGSHPPPYALKLIELKNLINERMSSAKIGLRKWEKIRQNWYSELDSKLANAKSLAGKVNAQYTKLRQAYVALREGASRAEDTKWYITAGKILGLTDISPYAIFSKLRETESATRLALVKPVEICKFVEDDLAVERKRQATHDYLLTLEDIGSAREKTGLAGKVKEVKSIIGSYSVKADKGELIFIDGVIPASEFGKVVQALKAAATLEKLAEGARAYDNELLVVMRKLTEDDFSRTVALAMYDPTTCKAQAEAALNDLSGFGNLKALYYSDITAKGDLTQVQAEYDRACEKVLSIAKKYLDPEIRIKTRKELETASEEVNNVYAQLSAARDFKYGDVKGRRIVSEDDSAKLFSFKEVLSDANMRLQRQGRMSQEGDDYGAFLHNMVTARAEHSYGIQDRYFQSYVSKARACYDRLKQDSSEISSEVKSDDPRVAEVLKDKQKPVIPENYVQELEEWEKAIENLKAETEASRQRRAGVPPSAYW